MKTYTYENSQALFARAAQVIPGGIYGHMSPTPLVPPSDYPFYVSRAEGARFWDVDGNEFIDYMCAYGPIVLGYNHPVVEEAARKQAEQANCVTAPSAVMVELAEYMTQTISIADWAFFAKNGGDMTAYALMVARAATGRKKTVLIRGGYHGVAPWAQAPGHHGLIEEDWQNTIRIGWNNFDEFQKVVEANKGQIAAFMATPYHHPAFGDSELPAEGYWQKVQQLCTREGIILIVDDVRCGFRLDMRGSNEYFGFKPDLICFCKAIGNGHPISALVGTEALKTFAAKVFYTGSYWFSAVPMAAALATLKELNRINAPQIMIEKGKKVFGGMVELGRKYDFEVKLSGVESMPYVRVVDADQSNIPNQKWCAESTKRGAYLTSHHNWFISTAHSDDDIARTLEICEAAFKEIRNAAGA